MKTQAKDAVALAMDWLAQLRDEDGTEWEPGDGTPAIVGAPPADDLGGVPQAAPPAADSGDAAPAAPPADDLGGVPPAAPPVTNWEDAVPAGPTATDPWRAAAPPPGDSGPVAAVPLGTTSRGLTRVMADIDITERAAIGDELRIPLAWCEMGSCISHYADSAALGEADIRARAIEAGWRVDALGRLACPRCQQGDSWFWTAHPVALWDRDTAVAMTTLMAAAAREITSADGGAGMETGTSPGGEPGAIPGGVPDAVPGTVPRPRPEMARPAGRGRHREHPAHADRTR